MSDTLGGIQRHSSDSFWKPYVMISCDTALIGDVEYRLLVQSGVDCNKKHDTFTVYDHGVPFHAILVPEDDADWWFTEVIRLDVMLNKLWSVSAPEPTSAASRYVRDTAGNCIGVVCDFGLGAGCTMQYPLVFKSNTTGHHFVPKMTGWLTREPGKCIVAVNKPSEGPRYRDHA